MPFYRITKFSIFFFLWATCMYAQSLPTKNYTSASELPNNAVRSLLVDSNNTLWIGTENGIVKKENGVFGYFFEEDGLALNSCWAIAEDKNKKLWFGSYGEGVSIYDGFKFKVISQKEGLVHNEITKLFTYQNFMVVGTSDGISLVDINTFKVLSLKEPHEDELFRVQDFFEYRRQIYVVTYNSGIFKIDIENKNISLTQVNEHKFNYSILVDNDSIYSSNKGFFTKNSLNDYVSEMDSISQKKYGHSIIWDYTKTNSHKTYAAAWGIYDSSGGIYELIENKMISRASEFEVSSKEVISLAYDGNFEKLYLGTKDSGLFEVALNPQIKFDEIKGKDVLGFAKNKNTSALLLNDGIVLKGMNNEREITSFQLKKWQRDYIFNAEFPLPKYQDDFYELNYSTKASEIDFYDIKVSQGIYWVNTNLGIFAINYSGELYCYLPLHSEEINFTQAGNLIETNPYGGVRIYNDLDDFKYTSFRQVDSQTPTMVVSSLQKGNKTYFLSIFSGLYVWENKEFKSYLNNRIWGEKKLKHITTLGENIAISNEFGDVFILNDQKSFNLIKKIPRAEIQGNTISFLEEYRGDLIVGTEKGLTLFKSNRTLFLDSEQGLEQPLLSAEVNRNILSVGSNERLYRINLDAVSDKNTLVSEVNLKEIYVNNSKFPLELASIKTGLELAHNENTIMLKFSTNAHPYPNKLKYQYRLKADDKWSVFSEKPEIFLASLPYGSYDIDIKILDESTGFSSIHPLLNLSILPPFWWTWWFALLIIGIISILILSVYKYQIIQNRRFEEQKGLIQKRFEETKMEALLAQMNPHFIFNAMNSIQYYIMESDTDNATLFLSDFAKLIRLNLDHCTRPSIFLSEEIEYLKSYIHIENTRFNNAIKVIFEIDPQIEDHELEVPTMLLQTFVENVFVHAFPTNIINPTLIISFKLSPKDVLHCKIEDNGIGFSNHINNSLHKSKGVNLVKERLTLLGYNTENVLEIISEKNKGTSILLKLQV